MATGVPTRSERSDQLTIISHSQLFYWWPVWVVGFIMGIISLIDNHKMAILPEGSEVVRASGIMKSTGESKSDKLENQIVIVLPKELSQNERLHLLEDPANPESAPKQLHLNTSGRPGFGVIFAVILLLVIVITNVPMRGMWSVVIILTVLFGAVIFHLAGWWGPILRTVGLLDIRINAGGYFFISAALLIVWLITVFVFDRQIYIVFTPGQFKVCTEIGGGERVYDTMGLNLEKHRDDFFRHLILGLGSGDLVVKTSGAQMHQFDLPNVLFLGSKVKQIEDLLKQRKVIDSD